MRMQLTHTEMLLGIEADIDSALALDLIPGDCPLTTLCSGEQIPAAFCELGKGENKLERIISLLEALVEKLLAEGNIDFKTTPVFWLLPELTVQGAQPLIHWASVIKERFPGLFIHPKSQFFPFGRSAFMMSVDPMEALFEQQTVNQVCVIAVDSLFHDIENLAFDNCCLTAESGNGLIPSEGVIVTCISPAQSGIKVLFNETESATEIQRTQAVESLFYKMTTVLNDNPSERNIDTFYAPGNGLENTISPWLNAYIRLASYVDKRTQLKQTAMFTGELGCVGGLYNFLHIYHAYQNQSLSGVTLQLEISDVLYQAVNLYSWSGKD
ncbi:hypothetical protein [Psychromonas aquimarina]|uniref:hypothetical protein n=1 Tax=Psychromonas aquimarina TaxID=444919 RepID=UPI00041B9768|nr:hypothetical protein [Psychromonas aquimarina]